jgi:hypothetical protein
VLAVGAGLLALGAGAGMVPAVGPGAGSALLRLVAAGALIAAAGLVLPLRCRAWSAAGRREMTGAPVGPGPVAPGPVAPGLSHPVRSARYPPRGAGGPCRDIPGSEVIPGSSLAARRLTTRLVRREDRPARKIGHAEYRRA